MRPKRLCTDGTFIWSHFLSLCTLYRAVKFWPPSHPCHHVSFLTVIRGPREFQTNQFTFVECFNLFSFLPLFFKSTKCPHPPSSLSSLGVLKRVHDSRLSIYRVSEKAIHISNRISCASAADFFPMLLRGPPPPPPSSPSKLSQL